uniref:Uncharacterized protein n=1 Tax=Lactuca sativa TaxID=4236 RepID=A0A9R1VQA1_LACSA|nr:hypothetical protein LSAT_V11C400166190 [Lactuca sativa]
MKDITLWGQEIEFWAKTRKYMSFSESEHKESFTNLSVYLHNHRWTNLHSCTNIKIDVMDLFQLHTFIGCLLLVIFICSMHLRGDYLNTMFILVVMDVNNQTLPIAFGLGMVNNVDSFTWFLIIPSLTIPQIQHLMRLKEALGEGKEVSFITNMDNVINFCIGWVFPDSYHGYTCKSVFIYMRRRVGGNRTLEPLFWMTSNSYIMFDYEQNFRRLTHDAREVLVNIDHAK